MFDFQTYRHYRSRPLRPKVRERVDHFLPQLLVAPKKTIPIDDLFDFAPKALWLEIGFGKGEHLLSQMRQNPDIGFIGCELYFNGIAQFLTQYDPQTDHNIRLFDGDGRHLLYHLPHQSLDRLFLLYPDPWPKYRHRRRRFIQPETLDRLALILKSGALIDFASDDMILTAWVLTLFKAHPHFDWIDSATNYAKPPFLTRYEAKAAQRNRLGARLVFCRKNC